MTESVSEKEWTGFHYLPAATQTALHGLLGKLHKQVTFSSPLLPVMTMEGLVNVCSII